MTDLEDRARVDIASAILYPFRQVRIPSPDEDIHCNRYVVEALTGAEQPPVHEEELVLALVARDTEVNDNVCAMADEMSVTAVRYARKYSSECCYCSRGKNASRLGSEICSSQTSAGWLL